MTAFLLKIIASFTMLLDHSYVVVPNIFPLFFRYIGRIAFPVYAYMIAQGCKYTSNIGKYLLRLGIFAIISEIPYDLAFGYDISFIRNTNIFYTLFLAAACIAVYKKIREKLTVHVQKDESSSESINETGDQSSGNDKPLNITKEPNPGKKTEGIIKNRPALIILSIIAITPIALLGNLLETDYGTRGVVFILIFYFTKPENRLTRTIAAICIVSYMYGYPRIFDNALNAIRDTSGTGFIQYVSMNVSHVQLYYFLFSFIAAFLILIYNGKPGKRVKWAFYAFYPVHLLILVAFKYMSG